MLQCYGCVYTGPIYRWLNILSRCLFTDRHLLVKRFKLPKCTNFKNGVKQNAFTGFSCIYSCYIKIEMMSPHLTSWGSGFCSQVPAAIFFFQTHFTAASPRACREMYVLYAGAMKYIGSWLSPLENLNGPKEL